MDPEIVDLIFAIAMFASVVAIIGLVMYFRAQRAKAVAAAGGDYQKLAEEAVRSQRVLLGEVQQMNVTLKEIERLLREV